MLHQLPPENEMYRALIDKDPGYEGIFVVGVKTTGIFCRPTCPARKPRKENVEFYASPKEALDSGYRPCKRCEPLKPKGTTPGWVEEILERVEDNPTERWTDSDIEALGFNANRLRRWFKKHHRMTFHEYLRLRRLGKALGQIKHGKSTTQTAFENGYESLSGFREAMKNLIGKPVNEGRETTVVYLNRITTPIGPMLAGTTERGLCLLEFVDRRMLEKQLERLQRHLRCAFVPGSNAITENISDELEQYFKGTLRRFTVPLDLAGSDFQKKVWKQLQTIPYAQTRSYEEQAKAIGNENAIRVVARANGDNRIAIVIPCHRVIGKDGSLTGYGGGIWRKRYLLQLERKHVDEFVPENQD